MFILINFFAIAVLSLLIGLTLMLILPPKKSLFVLGCLLLMYPITLIYDQYYEKKTNEICSNFNLDYSNCKVKTGVDKNLLILSLVLNTKDFCDEPKMLFKNDKLEILVQKEKCVKKMEFQFYKENFSINNFFIRKIPFEQLVKMSKNPEVLKKIDDFMSPSVSNKDKFYEGAL